MAALFVGSCDDASDDVGGGEGPEDESSQECELNISLAQSTMHLKGSRESRERFLTRSVGDIVVKV
jgi:hypothetical protein